MKVNNMKVDPVFITLSSDGNELDILGLGGDVKSLEKKLNNDCYLEATSYLESDEGKDVIYKLADFNYYSLPMAESNIVDGLDDINKNSDICLNILFCDDVSVYQKYKEVNGDYLVTNLFSYGDKDSLANDLDCGFVLFQHSVGSAEIISADPLLVIKNVLSIPHDTASAIDVVSTHVMNDKIGDIDLSGLSNIEGNKSTDLLKIIGSPIILSSLPEIVE